MDAVLGPVDEECRLKNAGRKVDFGDVIPREGVPTLQDNPINAGEVGVEGEAAYGVVVLIVLDGSGSKVAGLAEAKGAALEDDGWGRGYGRRR